LIAPLVPRGKLASDVYRASVVPHLIFQAGGRLPFEQFRRAFWLLTEPTTLSRFARGEIGDSARVWSRSFKDKLEKADFIPHLRNAIRGNINITRVDDERWIELRDASVLSDDEHAVFDARLALLVADLWPATEPIEPMSEADELAVHAMEIAQ
jgi:hypothetical protein